MSSPRPGTSSGEGSFIVYYHKEDYTEFKAPVSPLVRLEGEHRDATLNNRIFEPEKAVEAEGTLTRIVYVIPEGRSPL